MLYGHAHAHAHASFISTTTKPLPDSIGVLVFMLYVS
jgi:hypothetical protein